MECGGGTLEDWFKERFGNEISGWKDCPPATDGHGDNKVRFKTNNLEPKWTTWYNYADWMWEIEINGSQLIKYTVGIEELDSSWKALVSKGGSDRYEYEWIYSNSAFNGTNDG